LNNKLRLEIEERKRADQSSRESEHTLKSILAASPVGISLSCDRQMKWCNDAWLSMFGFETEGECENLSAEDVYPSREEFERVGQILYDGLESGRVTEAEAAFRRKDASTFYGQIAMKALEPSDPSRGVIAVIRDVTDHRKAQDALRDGEIRYKSLYSMMRLMCDNVPDHIWAKDLEGRYLFVNRAICEGLLGAIDTHEPVGKSDLFFMDRERNSHQDNLDWHTFGEICVDSDQVVMRTKKPERFEESGNVMGELLCLDVYKAPFWNEQGEMIGTVGCGRDVTEEKQNDRQRKQAEESLRESEERYRRLVQLSPDGIGVHIGGRLLFANKSLADLLGVASPEQLIDRSITEFLHPDRRETGAARLDELHQGKPRKLIEEKLVRVDGTIIDVEVAAVRVSYQAKAAVQIVLRDITTRLRLKEAQRRLATAVEQAADAVVIADHLGNVQYVNPGFGLMTGYSREEVTGKTLGFLENDEHDRASWESMLDSVVKGEVWQGRVVGKRKDAGPLHAILTISPVRDTDGEIRNFVGVAHDITRQMLLERQLLQAQKMEAIGTLTGGIAHDFNNLLQVIQGYSDLLLDEKPEDHPERADLLKIFQAAKNGAQLVQRLLTYSRKVEPKPIPLNLNRQIVQVEKLLRRTIPKMIEIEMDLAGALAEINADPIQIEQVLMNLAVNARDAMPEGGKLNLQTRNVFLDDEYCGLHIGSRTGQYVLLVVSDTGHGIDEATIEHIFEPFYTTKEPGRGTGLGLAMVYGIVKQHGGYITCESEVRVGTVFHVYFPQIQATPETQAPVTDIPYMGGTETILLVDDEAVVRELGERFLTNAGYFVITAENGEVALEVFKEKGEQIALVLLDLFMPKLGGKECLRKLLRIDPRVKILVASGYPADASIRESFDSGARGFVTKPFGFKELLQQVRKVLDED
jgi:PAS domain S-box-containing protein